MAVQTTKTNKPFNPRGNDQSPKGYNRAALYSGKALDFDGVNDKVDLPTLSFDLYTFSFYYEGAINSGSGKFVFHTGDGTNDGVAIGSLTSLLTGEALTIGNNANYTAITESFDDAIHFIVCTWNATENKYDFYLNAQKLSTINSGTDAPLISLSTAPAIGYRKAIGDMYLNGNISNVRAFNTALTAAQVADLYNNPEKVVPTGVDNTALKLWLPMQEGAGTTAYDGSGNGNHGTISGATYVNGVGAPVAQTAVIDWNKASNLLVQSNSFSTTWSSYLASLTSGQSGYDGGTNAWLLSKSGAYGSIFQVNTLTTGNYTLSVYMKAGTNNKGSIRITSGSGNDIRRQINLTNGTIAAASGSSDNPFNEVATNLGDGWWRFSISGTMNSTSITTNIYAGDTADTSGNIYIQDAQLEKTDEVGAYVETFATAQTSPVLLPQGLTSGRDITGVNLFENVRKQGALNLDGNSWAEVHDNASLDVTTGVSVEAWVYFDEDVSLNGKGIVSKWKGTGSSRCYMIYLDSLNRLRLYINGGSSTGIVMTGKNWYHVVGTFDQSNRKVYINGSLEATDADTSTINVSDLSLEIGTYNDLSANAYNNQIAQPRIYNRALTAEEVQRSYDSGKNIFTNS